MAHFIRTAMERDLPAISALLTEASNTTRDAVDGSEKAEDAMRDEHSIDALRPRLDRPSSEFVVADSGEEIAGVAFAASADNDRSLVVLHQLYVHPNARQSGVGAELLEEIMAAFPDGRRIRHEIETANTKAVRFYEEQGFTAISPAQTGEQSASDPGITAYERPL